MEQKVIMAPGDGIDKSLPVNLIADTAWSDGFNVQFGVGYVKKVNGWSRFFKQRDSWQPNHGYVLGELVVPTTANRHVYKCTGGAAVNFLSPNQSSVETDISGFTAAAGATVSRDTANPWQGAAGLKVVCPGTQYYDGGSVAISGTFRAGENYWGSCYVKGRAGRQIIGRFSADGGSGGVASVNLTLSGSWQRLAPAITLTAGAAQLALEFKRIDTGALTFWVDGLQIERGPQATDWTVGGASVGSGWSTAVEPVWPLGAGGSVADGGVIWTEVGVNQLEGTLQLIDNFFKYNDDSYLMLITTTKIYYYDSHHDTVVDITGGMLSGDITHVVTSENAQDYFIFTNQIDPVKYWDGSGTIKDLPGLTNCEGGVTLVRAKCLAYYCNFLMLGDTTENGQHCPQRIRWSRMGDITQWINDDDGTGQAGYADLADGVDWVQLLRPMKDSLIVYKERSIQVLAYVGGDLIFDKRPAIIGTGLLATNALCDLGDEHVFVGPDNVYSFDLIEPKIAGDAVAKEFFRLLDPGKANLTTNFFIEEIPEAWFPFVSIDSPDGSPDKAIVYNTDTRAWSWRTAPMLAYGYYELNDDLTIDLLDFPIDSWDSQIDSSTNLANSPINISGDAAGNLFILGGNSYDGADIDSYLVTKLFDCDNPGSIKRLLRVQLMISREGPYVLPVYVGTADNVDEPVQWNGPYNMSLDKTYPPWIDLDVSSRYFCLKFGTVLKEQPFKLTGYILYYQLRGVV